ncbi:hypothetical protein M433DRAFT_7122 [Acidomyces richmondensis BFW]|nr:hypothetical protein M433DRAFT_7122 [Acidomyces richmondensis BFW]
MPEHQGYEDALNLTISLCLTFSLCIACVRIWIRKGAFGIDDFVIAVATAITLGNAAASYVSLADGMGLPWFKLQRSDSLSSLEMATIAGVISFIIALYVSKCAMLFFLCRITKTPAQIKLFRACNVIVAVLGVLSALIATIACPTNSGYYWAFYANRTSCPSQIGRWQAITGLDVASEVILLALPFHLVWGLQMPLYKKAMIIIAFCLRLPVLGFSIGRNYYTLQLARPGTDQGLVSALVVIWIEVELAYALAASTLSALKAFTEGFNSGFGLAFTRGKDEGSYGLSNISGSSGQSSRTEKPRGQTLEAARNRVHVAAVDCQSAERTMNFSACPKISNTMTIGDTSLKLRPESELKTVTHVCAEPVQDEYRFHQDTSSACSNSSGNDDLVIMRETGYDVQHDEIPMLPPPCSRV